MEAFDPIVASYIDYCLNIKKNKKLTVKDIRCSFGKLQNYLASERMDDFIWELDLAVFIRFTNVLRQKGERGSGISKQLSHIRGFLDYCWRVGHCDRNVLKNFDIKDDSSSYLARFLTEDEIKKLIGACKRETKLERKERLMILMLYGLGLRTSELCLSTYKDINFEKQELFVRGKFDVERTLPIPGGVWMELLSYLQENGAKRGYIFKTDVKKVAYGVGGVGAVLRKYVTEAGLTPDITPKALRHTFACHLLDKGVDIAVISTLMGHKSPAETNSYLHAFEKNKQKAITQMDDYFQEEQE